MLYKLVFWLFRQDIVYQKDLIIGVRGVNYAFENILSRYINLNSECINIVRLEFGKNSLLNFRSDLFL